MTIDAKRAYAAELLGTALLLATVVGSGIMAQRLSPENLGVALLANAVATGGILYVLITLARSFTDTFAGIRLADAPLFIAMQLVGGSAAALVTGWLLPAPRKP